MQQQIAVITLGVTDLDRSKAFYRDGFGWSPVFENDEIAFYQMNGFVLGTWLKGALEGDMGRSGLATPGAFALAHNVGSAEEVDEVIARLVSAGGRLLRGGTRQPMAGSEAMWPIRTIMRGRSPGTRLGRSPPKAM
ncbi:MAG: VOC family protein [Phenylobacterium sp.]|uniref:VOC family protein n=1 Tax=Phenylobacterium sp. TaxID=1871053 RepID=UPI002734A568|nr:VOC family protein [Phenylobacterium sp.]MDP3748539.1 VOC family protein [Phenylobacterium sp.]